MELRTLIVLKNKGLSNRKVASMLKINRTTVDSYISRFKAFELSWEELLQLGEVDLRDLFTEDSQTEKDRYEALSAEFSGIQAKMTTPGATLQELWREYYTGEIDTSSLTFLELVEYHPVDFPELRLRNFTKFSSN